ncbi:phage scaffolding protein [Metaclostridioides mangenotii]|uniref:Phage minor structural protein GP20 n=1 Tax=Metaclostridioides mangenotii TaxID=1540 RepID=A0ABS4EBT9_9FIRM|nr:phage scaffolding protein [Clostridioides mangenotii]MBP1855399.1 hypothetical protein [Clostridioides mangenotii]
MTKKELIELGLSEEDAKKVEEASLNELKSFIPKNRFDEVNASKKQLETDIAERDKQLETLKKAGNVDDLKQQIESLQLENTANKEKYESEMSQVKLDNVIENSLITSKARNTKAVKALLNMDNIKLDGDNIIGLEDQLKQLKEDENSKFMFDLDTKQDKANFKGVNPAEGRTGNTEPDRPLTLTEAIKARLEGNNNE